MTNTDINRVFDKLDAFRLEMKEDQKEHEKAVRAIINRGFGWVWKIFALFAILIATGIITSHTRISGQQRAVESGMEVVSEIMIQEHPDDIRVRDLFDGWGRRVRGGSNEMDLESN